MSYLLFLDSGPLGLITQPQRTDEVIAITDWLKDCLWAGARVLVPAIVYYEIKRELLRANKLAGISRLDSLVNAQPDRYVPLTDGTPMVATTNENHLSQIISALHWTDISPSLFLGE